MEVFSNPRPPAHNGSQGGHNNFPGSHANATSGQLSHNQLLQRHGVPGNFFVSLIDVVVTSRHVTSRHVTSRHVTSRHVTSRHVTSRHVTSRHVTSRYVTSRYVMSYQCCYSPFPWPQLLFLFPLDGGKREFPQSFPAASLWLAPWDSPKVD
jgi:hypothetical protein